MKKKLHSPSFLIFFIALVASGCFSRTTMMNRQSFDQISLGMRVEEFEDKVGKPFAIRDKSNGCQEYEYIERLEQGTEWLSETHYILIVRDGQVVAKRIAKEKRPAYDLIDQEDPNNFNY